MYDMMSLSYNSGMNMRTTVNIDDALLKKASQLTGIKERATLLRAGLKALIEQESSRRLAALGGSEPQLRSIDRRRSQEA